MSTLLQINQAQASGRAAIKEVGNQRVGFFAD